MKTRTDWKRIAVLMLLATAGRPSHGETVAREGVRSSRVRHAADKHGGRQLAVVPDADHVFPCMRVSGAWTSTIYLSNLENRQINVTRKFVGTNGEEKQLQFSFAVADYRTEFTESKIAKFSTESFSRVSTENGPDLREHGSAKYGIQRRGSC